MRWGPLTGLATIVSAWWVKGPLLLTVAACGDLRAAARRITLGARIPSAFAAAAIAFVIASAANAGLKDLFQRERPPTADVDLSAVVSLPASYSFPSGHAMTAFAAAIAVVRPELRWLALGLAAAVAMTRPYLGVHFWSDVIVGAGLGAVVGIAVGRLVLAGCRVKRRNMRAGPAEAGLGT